MKPLISLILLSVSLSVNTAQTAPMTEEGSAPPPPIKIVSKLSKAVASSASKERRVTLKSLMGREMMKLDGVNSLASVAISERSDVMISKARLHLTFTPSPSLIPRDSHIKIIVNGLLASVIPITKDDLGTSTNKDIELDTNIFTDLNQVQFQFIGHYTRECEDPFNTTLWLDIAGNSYFDLTLRPISLINDLSLLPEPFFNPRDFSSHLEVPFVFSKNPDNATLNAAGIVSSWFGKLAAWRGADFPTTLNQLPSKHSIVFSTNDKRPDFLSDRKLHPDVKGPTLEMITNPLDGKSKLLLILGRDGADLKIAAKSLALGAHSLSGNRAFVHDLQQIAPRKEYDAPNWVHMDRPTRFGELITNPLDLQVSGYSPTSIKVPMRLPPDLFTWRSRGIAMDLKYRYTPPLSNSEARLRIGVNDELVKVVNLSPTGEVEKNRIRLPIVDDLVFGEAHSLLIPSFKLGARNELQFQFSSPVEKSGVCRDFIPENVRSMIDADSTVDFSGYHHYIEMPNLNTFATAGFPFTKYADLSQTVVVMPTELNRHAIEVMLSLLAHMGEITGYPATEFLLTNASNAEQLKDADLLVIGNALNEGVMNGWSEKLPIALNGRQVRNSQPKNTVQKIFDWVSFETPPTTNVANQQNFEQDGFMSVMMGFESPLTSERSVVAVLSNKPEALSLVVQGLSRFQDNIYGSATFFHPNKTEGTLVGNTYHIGHLPLWKSLWYRFAQYPVLLAILAVISVLLIALALWRILPLIASKRNKQEG
jgi:hypothetical protein